MKELSGYYCSVCCKRVGGKWADPRIRVVVRRCACDPKPEPKPKRESVAYTPDQVSFLRKLYLAGMLHNVPAVLKRAFSVVA